MNNRFSKLKQWMNVRMGKPQTLQPVPTRTLGLEELSMILYFSQKVKHTPAPFSYQELMEIQQKMNRYYLIKSQKMNRVVPILPTRTDSDEGDCEGIEWSDEELALIEKRTEGVEEKKTEKESVPQKNAHAREPQQELTEKKDLRFARILQSLLLFLQSHYHLRYNVLTDATELGKIVDTEIQYQPITRRELNTICMKAQMEGINCWDKDVTRCIDSEYIESYHPFKDYIDHLPAWDGIDRVTPLAHRVSADILWTRHFHVWMRGMMAQWMGMLQDGKGVEHAHTLAPILISPDQGCGKSTFCRMLLPKELRTYYTDSFDVLNANGCDKKLAKFGLINLDEFDNLSKQGITKLKNHMQKTELVYRVGNQKQATYAPRLASFIGTTNRRDVMTDPTGSRRFICVEVQGFIDCQTPIDYPQLYAQLKQELSNGEAYWLSKGEEKLLEKENRRFYRMSSEEEMFFELFRFATPDEKDAVELSATQIYQIMRKKYRSALKANGASALGKLLKVYQEPRHTNIANYYCVVQRG